MNMSHDGDGSEDFYAMQREKEEKERKRKRNKKKFYEILQWTGIIVGIILFLLFVFNVKRISYNFKYKKYVEDTVREMVKEEYLKDKYK